MMKRYIQPSSRIAAIVEEMRLCTSSDPTPVTFKDKTVSEKKGI